MQKDISMQTGQYVCLRDFSKTSTEITLVHAGKEYCKPYHTVSASRDEYIIHFVLSGNGLYSVNGNTWFLGPGQMFLIYPDEPVIYWADTNNPWSYVWIGFKGVRVDTILDNCGFSKKHLILPAPDPNEYMDCFDDLFEHRYLGFSEDLYRESILIKLFSILSMHHSKPELKASQEQSSYSDNVYINLAIDYIAQMYMQGIRVSDIADSIGITRSPLNHVFQKELSTSIQNFLMDFRLNKSANLLAGTVLPIKEVSSRVGYKNQLTFSKAFKKRFGVSPKSYRTYQNKGKALNQ